MAISLFVRLSSDGDQHPRVRHAELVGPRDEKYQRLAVSSVDSVEWRAAEVEPPTYFFRPTGRASREYEAGVPVDKAFYQYSAGMITARDALVIDFDRDVLRNRVTSFSTVAPQ